MTWHEVAGKPIESTITGRTGDAIIGFEEVSRTYYDSEQPVVKALSFEVHRGELPEDESPTSHRELGPRYDAPAQRPGSLENEEPEDVAEDHLRQAGLLE